MALDKIGINSLQAVNQWIGVINSNLQSASRTGYKNTRVNFTDGLGFNSISDNLSIPSSTLTIQSTQIEWGQGSIINSNEKTHFALQGEGFFVLHDSNSNKYYLSRDGEFHWSGDGFLVNSAGLKVVSAGQDYVRYGQGDKSSIFSPDGNSVELERYGNKSFMVLDVLNRGNLRMSQFGSTVFELDGNLTTRINNSFNQTTDGLTFVYDDPVLKPTVDSPGFITALNPPLVNDLNYTIDFGDNGIFTGTLNVATDSIDSIVNAINTAGLGAGLTVRFDTDSDRLIIENTVATGGINHVIWGGTNGNAMREFFKISNDNGIVDEINSPTTDTNIVTSRRDIDNSYLVPYKDIGYVDEPGAPVRPSIPLTTPLATLIGPNPTYTHVKATATNSGYVESIAAGGNSMIIGESASTGEFDIVTDLKVSNTGVVIFAFGQRSGHSFFTGGYDVRYDAATGNVTLRAIPDGYKDQDLPVTLGPAQNVGFINNLAAGTASRVAIRLDGDRNLTFSVEGGGTATFNLGGGGQTVAGALTLRNAVNTMQVHSLYADFKRSSNVSTTGEMVSVGYGDIANLERGGVYGSRPRTRVLQNSLESSEASLTEYLPMLSLAQKVFSSISKIISTFNNLTDDVNTLLR